MGGYRTPPPPQGLRWFGGLESATEIKGGSKLPRNTFSVRQCCPGVPQGDSFQLAILGVNKVKFTSILGPRFLRGGEGGGGC